MIKFVKGDLLELAKLGKFDIIVHGCNCFNAMGGGIARAIAQQFPEAEKVDSETHRGLRQKLGLFTSVDIDRYLSKFTIINLYTQYAPSTGGDVFEYDAFRNGLKKIDDYLLSKEIDPSQLRFGFPLIGCGLAGGDKERIMGILTMWAWNHDVTVVTLPGN